MPKKANNWKNINTDPGPENEGREVLLYARILSHQDNQFWCVVGSWPKNASGWKTITGNDLIPSHWQELPDPPMGE